MSALLLVTSILGELGAIGAVYGQIVLELRDRASFDFAIDGDAVAIEQLSDLSDGLLLTQPALNLLTLGESNVLAFSGNGVTMRLGVLVHSVWVCYREITLAYFELLGTLFCAKNLLHLILRSTMTRYVHFYSCIVALSPVPSVRGRSSVVRAGDS